jgi:dCMP deaminase
VISDAELMREARKLASYSRDETKVGCAISNGREIVAGGFNDFPANVSRSILRFDRPEKYFWTEHAERNAIYSAARTGTRLHCCTAAVTWYPCCDCARAVIQSGISHLVCGKRPDLSDPKWGEDFARVEQMLLEGGITVRFFCEP